MLARLLGRQTDDYRKDNETALVVEPALDLLKTIRFRQSRKVTRKDFLMPYSTSSELMRNGDQRTEAST